MIHGPLGRLEPTDWKHVEKYPLRGLVKAERPKCVPVVLGIPWYSNFDTPTKPVPRGNGRSHFGSWWIGLGDLGSVRGGHAVCVEAEQGPDDTRGWYEFYDQGEEGACVGFACSRAMSILNRKRYDARWLYEQAQFIDEWPGEDYSGTSVRAAFDVLQARGHRVMTRTSKPEDVEHGISAFRWAQSVDEVLAATGAKPSTNHVVILNSWGRSYPQRVKMPLEVLDRLLRENGEAGIVTDR